MKLLKWVLIAVGAVVLLFAAALAFIAATFDPNQYKTQVIDLVREKTQRTLTIEGDIRLMLFPKLGVHLGRTRLSEFKSEKDFAALDDMRVSLALIPLLSRQVVVDQIQLDGLRADLVKHRDGKTNFDDLLGGEKPAGEKEAPAKPAEPPAAAQAPIKLEVDGVRISKAALAWKDEISGAEYAVSDFNLKTGRVAPGVPTKFDLGAIITANKPKVDVKLQVGGTLTADLEKQVFSVAGLTVKLTGNAAGITGLAIEVSGSGGADLRNQTANADLAAKLDESSIKAKFAIADFAALRSTFDIAIDKLNVDRYLPPKKQGGAAKAPDGARPEQPIDLSPLKKLDLAGSLRIGDLTISNIKAQNVRVDVKASNGRLDVDPLAANLYQGSVNGTASVDANANRVAVKQTLSGISIGPLLRDAMGQDLLEGQGNVTLDVTTTGNLVSAMKKTLNGTARLELKDGAIKGINLAQSLRNARALLTGGKRESEQGAVTGEKTDFSELSASFVIRNGIAHNGDFLAKSPFLRLTGEGDINLPESTLNYLANATVVASSARQGGKEQADLAGLTIPVRAYGPFSALKYKFEFGSIFSDSAKQKFEEKKEAIKDKLKSKLLGKPAEPSGAAAEGGQSPAVQPKPEDKLKEKLKKLF
ncbi:MAG TPA: AsmA family protein [Burkholderiales bacterium]